MGHSGQQALVSWIVVAGFLDMGDMFVLDDGSRRRDHLALELRLDSCTHRLVDVAIDHASKSRLRTACVQNSLIFVVVIDVFLASFLAVNYGGGRIFSSAVPWACQSLVPLSYC